MPSRVQLLDIISIQTEIMKLGLDLGSVMTLVVERTLSLIGADGAAIELAEGSDMVYRAASGIAASQIGLRLERQHSLSGLCVHKGETLRCDDSEQDPRVDQQACRRVGLRSMVVIPLKHKDSSVGVLKAMSVHPAKFTDDDEDVLNLLSELVGAAMYFATEHSGDNLFHKATHDELTGLANRALFMDRLRNTISNGSRELRPAGILMIDMDGLKPVNDTFGHRVGDAVIREFATRIKSHARPSDTIARLGGDEFGVILTPIKFPEGVESAMRRLSSQIEVPFVFEENTHQLSASIGAAYFPDEGNDLERLLDVADKRMYTEKRSRRHRQSVAQS